MNYKVQVADRVKADVASWGFSRETLIIVYTRLLTDLPKDPGQYLVARIGTEGAYEYTMVLYDGMYRHGIVFAVDRYDDPPELYVVGCRHVVEGNGLN